MLGLPFQAKGGFADPVHLGSSYGAIGLMFVWGASGIPGALRVFVVAFAGKAFM